MWFLSMEHPQNKAIVINDQAITFGELADEVLAQAKQLKSHPQPILPLKATPDTQFISQFLAALHVHQPIALFHPQLSSEEELARQTLLGNQPHPKLALVLFTSGTAGAVKGVQLSESNMLNNCQAVIKALRFSEYKDQLLFLPLSYSFGLLGQLLPGLMTGLTTHILTQFTDIKTCLESGHVPELWSGVPSHWVAILKMARRYPDSANKVKAIVSAGAPLPISLRKELSEIFTQATLFNNYGLTEASPRVLTYSSDDPLFYEDYAGYPVGDWQIKLSAEGELLIQGPQMMLGYLGESQTSRIREGWLATGDLATIGPGRLVSIQGRMDNLVNIGGERIHLLDIEQKLSSIPGINDILVLPIHDALYGVRLLACCDINPEILPIETDKLTETVQRHLLPKKLPITARHWSGLPRNQHGKLDRTTLLNMILKESL